MKTKQTKNGVILVPQKTTINPYVECEDCGWDGLIEETVLIDHPVLGTRMSCPNEDCKSWRINTSK